jgi:hypothetical protein
MAALNDSIQWIFDLEEQGRAFHFDDDPAQVVNWHTGAPVFKPDELPAIREGVARCFATMQDPFFFLCQATMDIHDRTELVFFEHNGHAIHNPTMSECGRFEVSPTFYGFELWHTGGSNTAWRKELSDGRYLLLTDSEGGAGSTHAFKQGEPVLLGLYEGEGEPIAHSELTAGAL